LESDRKIRQHFKEKGGAPLPGNDFSELGIDLEALGIDDDLSDKQLYRPAVKMLCELTEVRTLDDMATKYDRAVQLGIEAFKTANVGKFNALESSKKNNVSSEQVKEIISYLVSQAYLADSSPNIYLTSAFFFLLSPSEND